MDYFSVFWGRGVISTINEPRGAFTCRSSILAVLADSGPFRGLLLSVLGCRGDFHDRGNPGVRLRIGHKHSRFWPILARFVDYYSLFWGPGVISTIEETPGCVYAGLADSGLLRGLLTVLGSRGDIHDRGNLGVRLRVGHKHSRFWPILARFVDY